MITKCNRCGLKLREHTDMKCNEILHLDRRMLLNTLEALSVRLEGDLENVKAALQWVKKRRAHDVLKNDPLYR